MIQIKAIKHQMSEGWRIRRGKKNTLECKPAPRPYVVSLARLMASSSVLKTPTDKTGPKICPVSACGRPDVCGDRTHLFFDLRDEREISALLMELNQMEVFTIFMFGRMLVKTEAKNGTVKPNFGIIKETDWSGRHNIPCCFFFRRQG